MPEMQMRFLTGGSHIADLKAAGETNGADFYEQALWDATPTAVPGDVWRVRWARTIGTNADGPIAGYAICCSLCLRVHWWTTALNCLPKPCPHEGVGSCWTWTGSAESNLLTASPSLHCLKEKGGCGFHGWLQNGILRG